MIDPKKFKMPRTAAQAADLLYQVREQRLAMQRDVDELAKVETQLKDFFINSLPKSDASGIAGRLARVQITTKIIPTVEDWDKLYAFVKKQNAFYLLQRRVSESAVKELWENNKQVPGVGQFLAPSVSCTKL